MSCLTLLILEGFAWLPALSHKLSDFYAYFQLFNNSYCRAATNPPTFTAPSGSLDLATEERSPFVVKNGQYSQLNSHHSHIHTIRSKMAWDLFLNCLLMPTRSLVKPMRFIFTCRVSIRLMMWIEICLTGVGKCIGRDVHTRKSKVKTLTVLEAQQNAGDWK